MVLGDVFGFDFVGQGAECGFGESFFVDFTEDGGELILENSDSGSGVGFDEEADFVV